MKVLDSVIAVCQYLHMPNTTDRLLTPAEVCEQLAGAGFGVHPKTLTGWANRGVFSPDVRLPGRGDRRWKQSTVEQFISSLKGATRADA